jgi:cyclic peptide transporter
MGILIMVTKTVSGELSVLYGGYNGLIFVGLIVFSFLATAYFQNYMVKMTNNILFDIELSIVQKVRNATLESFEDLGPEKIYGAISDARVLSRVPEIFITIINSFVMVTCALIYLFWMSPAGGGIVLFLMLALLLLYLYRDRRIARYLNQVRDLQDGYYDSLRELLDGFKQIRISARRSINLYNNFILRNRNKAKGLNILTSKKYVFNELVGTYSWYIVLGVIIFVLPLMAKLDIKLVSVFVTTVLFMMAPISQLIMFFPFFTGVKIAAERITKIEKALESHRVSNETIPDTVDFESITFENVSYEYHATADSQSTFRVEDLNLSISKGEIIFITGGNGSGKSTFINLLTGLYRPSGGRILLNGKETSWEEYVLFCNSIAAVYTNHYLFKDNYEEHDFTVVNPELDRYRDMFNLNGILNINKERNWPDNRLSKGQQKRLALVLAMMEKKPLLILDEWAAEQDPHNRRVFYTKWLNEFRDMGKTVIIVSHDDDFYSVADRIIKFDFGNIVSDVVQADKVF